MIKHNKAEIGGNIATDPVLRQTNSGQPVVNFILAINRRNSATGSADFIPVTVFGEEAKTLAEHKAKGHGLLIVGRLSQRNYKNGQGQTRTAVSVIAGRGGITFLPQKSSISVNNVSFIGNLTKDPGLSIVGSDVEYEKSEFSLAVDGMPSGDGESNTDFFDCTAWKGHATAIAKYKVKGDPIYLSGRLQSSSWEKNGNRYSKVEVVAEDTQFLPSKNAPANAAANAPAAQEDNGLEVSEEDFADLSV